MGIVPCHPGGGWPCIEGCSRPSNELHRGPAVKPPPSPDPATPLPAKAAARASGLQGGGGGWLTGYTGEVWRLWGWGLFFI